METIEFMVGFVVRTSVRFAPLFFLSILLAAVVKALPIAAVASRWLAGREHASIVAGSALGAFSPFCSCTVVPVVRSLLVAGAPLAGVMAFWVASPLMDLEIFLLSVGLLGWDIAVARLVAALALSLLAGFGAMVAVRRGWMREFGDTDATVEEPSLVEERILVGAGAGGGSVLPLRADAGAASTVESGCSDPRGCCTTDADRSETATVASASCGEADRACGGSSTATGRGVLGTLRNLDWRAVRRDVRRESWLMGRWILLAFALEALILRFVPQESLVAVLGADAPWAVPLAALLGVPLYMDSFSALPVISGLLEQGMAPGAAIAFLLAGPVTTIPAMTAVRAVLPGPVFRYYLGLSLFGSMALGMVANIML